MVLTKVAGSSVSNFGWGIRSTPCLMKGGRSALTRCCNNYSTRIGFVASAVAALSLVGSDWGIALLLVRISIV